jgi:hypothetical protein
VTRRERAIVRALLLLTSLGCGARTGLEVSQAVDAGPVDAARVDAGSDAGVPCVSSVEVCNGVDDDCDDRLDEGLGFGAIGEPIVVRDVDEHGDDRCSTCAIAFAPHAVSTSDGILVAFRIGFDGSRPIPNTFTRLLDDDAHPRAEIALLSDRNTTEGLRMTSHPSGAAMVYCGRFRSNDVTTSAIVSPAGALIDERAREPMGRSCGAWEPDTVWTGARTMFAWTDNSSGPLPGFEVLLDRGDADGVSLGFEMLEPNGDGGPRLGVGHGRLLLVVGTRPEPRRSVLAIHRFDLEGTRAGEPTYVPIPDGLDDSFVSSHVVPSREGFVVHSAAAARDGGRFVTRLGSDGALALGPVRLDEGIDYVNGFDDVLARRGGGAVIASPRRSAPGEPGYRVLAVDDEGAVLGAWDGDPAEGQPAWGGLVEHRGRVFLTYAIISGENRDQIRIRELGCVP